ncbi:MAG: DUF192 domain-containing protein [Candidatus Bilamarchaeaceae archaeon]
MELSREAVAFLIILFIFIALLLAHAELSTSRKQIRITNKNGEIVTVTVEIADNPIKRAKGLMFRQSLGEYEGMLFVFTASGRYSLWMVNTTIPLDAIFFDENRRVVDIIRMKPCNLPPCPTYSPKKNAKYILEVNAGFAEAHGITEGCEFSYVES